jgi:hypothetical protein
VIAERTATLALENAPSIQSRRPTDGQPLLLSRIVASLQVVLASRRADRNEEHAYWYTVARGM